MAKKGVENTKKVAGNAKKAENANKKKQAQEAVLEEQEAGEWEQGSKKANKKKEDEKFKKDEAARKKNEREALLKAEEASLPAKPLSAKQRGAAKVASRRTGKIDDFLSDNKDTPELSASGIDDALSALALTGRDGGVQTKDIDKHPERRAQGCLRRLRRKETSGNEKGRARFKVATNEELDLQGIPKVSRKPYEPRHQHQIQRHKRRSRSIEDQRQEQETREVCLGLTRRSYLTRLVYNDQFGGWACYVTRSIYCYVTRFSLPDTCCPSIILANDH